MSNGSFEAGNIMGIEEKREQIESILSELSNRDACIILRDIVNGRFWQHPLYDICDANKLHFPKVLDVKEAKGLFTFLIDGKYISENTNEKSFLYYWGCHYGVPSELEPIKWVETKQLLRELLEPLYCIVMSKEDIKRLAMKCFTDKNGKTMILAKNKCIPSTKSDDLKEFLATNKLSNNQS